VRKPLKDLERSGSNREGSRKWVAGSESPQQEARTCLLYIVLRIPGVGEKLLEPQHTIMGRILEGRELRVQGATHTVKKKRGLSVAHLHRSR